MTEDTDVLREQVQHPLDLGSGGGIAAQITGGVLGTTLAVLIHPAPAPAAVPARQPAGLTG